MNTETSGGELTGDAKLVHAIATGSIGVYIQPLRKSLRTQEAIELPHITGRPAAYTHQCFLQGFVLWSSSSPSVCVLLPISNLDKLTLSSSVVGLRASSVLFSIFLGAYTVSLTSGLAVASRLTEDPKVTVIVLEAGQNAEHIPEVSVRLPVTAPWLRSRRFTSQEVLPTLRALTGDTLPHPSSI